MRRSAPNEPRRDPRQGKLNSKSATSSRRPVRGVRTVGRSLLSEKHKRLSATDISALASMKNVAKCDTWCELQNPVNHRVFERKLRPKPLGRGHVCMGVTHRVASLNLIVYKTSQGKGERILASRALRRGWLKTESPAKDARQVVVDNKALASRRAHVLRWVGSRDPDASRLKPKALRPRPHVRRDYPLSLSISISGGKETYKDSLSNGERTGNSPA